MNTTGNRQTDLASLADAREAFTDAIESVPEEALGYLKPGDDYALGGLVFHVNAVLERYAAVLSAVLEAGFKEVTVTNPPGFEAANARAKEGLVPEQRIAALEEMKRWHDDVAASLESVDEADWQRKAPVHYGAGTDAFPTSPADINGWLTEHYLEHVPHASQLLADWKAAR
jgi:DinB superfamily